MKPNNAFTIVELLIVIVVIAILAAISVVAYNGIQQRSRNTAIISAANQSLKLMQGYIAVNSSYPTYSSTSGNVCITVDTGCVRDTGHVDNVDTAFTNRLMTIGSVPRTVAMSGTVGYGIIYNYTATRTYNGNPQPGLLFYWLEGVNQNCGMGGVMNAWDTATTSTTGYTAGNSSSTGKTLCFINVAGPAA